MVRWKTSHREDFSFPFADCLPLPSHPTIHSCFIISGMPSLSQVPALLSPFANDANFSKEWWDSLKEIDFGPNEKATEGSFNFIGLDKLTRANWKTFCTSPIFSNGPKAFLSKSVASS